MSDDLFKNIISHCKEYGFIFPSSEIYDGLGAVYDYGSNGVLLVNNIKEYWWRSMVQMHDNIVGIDSSIFMHPKVWKASGHVDAFNDPLVDNKDSKKRYRADVLIEDYLAKIDEKIEKEVEKARQRFPDNFDEKLFRETNQRVVDYQLKRNTTESQFKKALEDNDMAGLKAVIEAAEIVCPVSGSRNWTDVRQFNLMFSTQVGSVAEDSDTIYLRPETAQGIFVNFLNVLNTSRQRIPFGIAQIGKAFRNEIVARQFIFRMREFEQMEMQFFVRPGTEDEWYEYWKKTRLAWHAAIGMPDGKHKLHDHLKLAHYAKAAVDIEFEFPFGFKELEGIHSRSDFDLTQHQTLSGKKLQYFDPELNQSYVPYVVETSIGVSRMFLAVMSSAYQEEVIDNDPTNTRTVLKIHPTLAPMKAAVLPLTKKDGLPEKAKEIFKELKYDFHVQYDEKDAIGKRYRRQDAIGTPFCITIDHQTLEDDTVTIRERDSMSQERIPVSEILNIIRQKVDWRCLLSN
jgi:glycyl-tRNA synthetase